jgi:xanthine dehydrogenase iron-sulfur cluster and FAD-binding subunit A
LAHGISGNLCRCQDYDKILTALMRGAELSKTGEGRGVGALTGNHSRRA